MPREDVERIFKDKLGLDFEISKESMSDQVKSVLIKIKEKIKSKKTSGEDIVKKELSEEERQILYINKHKEQIVEICQEMIDFISSGFLKNELDRNKLGKSFWKKYNETDNWKTLLDDILVYKILKHYDSYRNEMLSGYGEENYRSIKNGINAIDKILKDEKIEIIVSKVEAYGENDFSSVNANDSAIAVIPAADLEVLRASENLPTVNISNDIRDYVGSSLQVVADSIKDTKRMIDTIKDGNDSVISELNVLDDALSSMGM